MWKTEEGKLRIYPLELRNHRNMTKLSQVEVTLKEIKALETGNEKSDCDPVSTSASSKQ